MMWTQSWLLALQKYRAIAVLRSPQLEMGLRLAEIAIHQGMGLIEVTWNSQDPALLVQSLRTQFPHCWIGAGTILTESQLEEAVAAGSQFIFSPHFNPQLVNLAQQWQIPSIPGALTPTEIVTAWQGGATCVKVFPIGAVGGSDYLRSLRAPLGNLPLIPTGGVTVENAASFLQAGAIAVGLSGQLFPTALIQAADWSGIQQRINTLQTCLARIPSTGVLDGQSIEFNNF